MNPELIKLLDEVARMWDRIDSNHVWAGFVGYRPEAYLEFVERCTGSIGLVVGEEYDRYSGTTIVKIRERKHTLT